MDYSSSVKPTKNARQLSAGCLTIALLEDEAHWTYSTAKYALGLYVSAPRDTEIRSFSSYLGLWTRSGFILVQMTLYFVQLSNHWQTRVY